MAEVELSRGKVALVSEDDLPLVAEYTWCYFPSRNTGYAYTMVQRKTLFMHRLIIGAVRGQIVDHVNRDGLDNRRENLRFCTPAQNRINSVISRNESGYRGVYRTDRGRKFRAHIWVSGKSHHLGGTFLTAEAAARAYDEAAVKHFGDYASLNFPRLRSHDLSPSAHSADELARAVTSLGLPPETDVRTTEARRRLLALVEFVGVGRGAS